MITKNYMGIIEDPRSEFEKNKDWQHEELFASAPEVKWEEREPKKFKIFNQNGNSSCVANGTAKLLGIDEVFEGREFVDLSRRDIYIRRANKSDGMYLPNALEIATKHGATLESLVPSELKHEAEMNVWEGITSETDKIAEKYKAKGYLALPINIDSIASITSQGKGVLLGFRFDIDEWLTFPEVVKNATMDIGHGVAGVDNILINGKKYLVIDDSWGFEYGKGGQRFISEEFLKARCFYAGYTLNLINGGTVRPKHTFTHWMRRGDKNQEIVWLQDCLKHQGFFPTNDTSTGYYGAITQSCVKKFQDKYLGYNNGGVQVGPATLKALNDIYS